MGITKIRGFLVIGLAASLLAGCASTEPEEAPVVEPVKVKSVEKAAPKPEIIKPRVVRGKIEIPRGNKGDTEILQGIFYFDFDQAIVKRGGHTELNDHAKVLAGSRMFRIRVEGHADERGTREYNLALGERRANAVRAYLLAQGASRSQIEVISYGEEKPAKRGHSESSWAQNRRVEIVYR
jgi:peptidoglycan-associated lipoprotein